MSIAGVPDHPLLNGSRGFARLEHFLDEAREHAVDVNAEWARRLDINPTAALTCLKPSGNTSQLVGAASPLKPRHAARYIRRTRASKSDPVTQVLQAQQVRKDYRGQLVHQEAVEVELLAQQVQLVRQVHKVYKVLLVQLDQLV